MKGTIYIEILKFEINKLKKPVLGYIKKKNSIILQKDWFKRNSNKRIDQVVIK